MDIRRTTKKIATGAAGVALASAGCSCGDDNVEVVPAPGPLVCTDDVNSGKYLYTTGTLTGTTLEVEISEGYYWVDWVEAQALNPVGVTVTEVRVPEEGSGARLEITLELTDSSVTTGSFDLQAKLKDASGRGSEEPCDITRTFTFTITGTAVELVELGSDKLPLGTRHRTAIAMVNRDARSVELEAKTTFPGNCRMAWTVSGGVLSSIEGNRACWRLPDKKGFYQAQVVTDFGDEGLAFDTINVEVV
jgi:hypothetical protein